MVFLESPQGLLCTEALPFLSSGFLLGGKKSPRSSEGRNSMTSPNATSSLLWLKVEMAAPASGSLKAPYVERVNKSLNLHCDAIRFQASRCFMSAV